MIEFAFCMIILFLMMYGIIMVFRWVGLDLGQRQQAHEAVLTAEIDPAYGTCVSWDMFGSCTDSAPVERGPLSQIDPYFYTPAKMNAVWDGQ
ncbi:MAG: pilus assembly protein [Candidatus Omnitrophica bacterium]|nr:pilus assembly protein [Candidatus Omnitrophota bacterium]